MIGVHGAAMTHFLLMRPGSVLIQVIPIGTAWAAEEYYGAPAKKNLSSLYDKCDKNGPILADPTRVNHKGWEHTKKIYLGDQTVRLDLKRFRKQLWPIHDPSTTVFLAKGLILVFGSETKFAKLDTAFKGAWDELR
ncbi:hypothetical protein ACE6H2_023564 [Prunus campanulata]